jgi:hypothetical protein
MSRMESERSSRWSLRDGGRAMLVLDDAGGEPLDRRLGAPMEGDATSPRLVEPWRFQSLRLEG